MIYEYLPIFTFITLSIVLVFVTLFISRILAPRFKNRIKSSTYECAEEPVGQAWINFNARFYIIGLIFIIFDVEVAFMFPVVTAFLSWVKNGQGLQAFIEIFLFALILFIGLIYVWAKKDLEWKKEIT
jgi:NADH-quinone oxidoreductase subunit A